MQCRWMMLPPQDGLWTTKRNRAQPVYHTNAMHRSQLRTWKPGLPQREIPHKSKSFRFCNWRVVELLLLMQMVGWSDQLEAALMKNTLLAAESSLQVFLKCWAGWCYEKLTNRYKKYPHMIKAASETRVSAIFNVARPSSHDFSVQLSELYGSEAIEAIGNCSQSNSTWKPKECRYLHAVVSDQKHIAISLHRCWKRFFCKQKMMVKRTCRQYIQKKSPTFVQSMLPIITVGNLPIYISPQKNKPMAKCWRWSLPDLLMTTGT